MKPELLLFVLLGSGCGQEAPLPPRPVRTFDLSEAEARFLEGDWEGAEAGFSLAARQGSPEGAAWLGRVLLKTSRPLEAEHAFRQALRGGEGERAEAAWARLGLADALMAQGRPGQALTEYSSLLRDVKALSTLDAAEVLYHAALASLRTGLWEEGGAHLTRIVASYPDSPFADMASERLEDVALRRFSVQLGAFAAAVGADRRIRDLAALGISARRTPIRRGEAVLHAVRVGRFAAYEEAHAEALRLRALGEEGVVVP